LAPDAPQPPLPRTRSLRALLDAEGTTNNKLHAFFDEAARQIGQYDPASDELLEGEELIEMFIHWPEIAPLGSRIPPTLHPQVDAEWRKGNTILDSDKPVLGAWEVSVPAFRDPEQHILSNTRAVSEYFSGSNTFIS